MSSRALQVTRSPRGWIARTLARPGATLTARTALAHAMPKPRTLAPHRGCKSPSRAPHAGLTPSPAHSAPPGSAPRACRSFSTLSQDRRGARDHAGHLTCATCITCLTSGACSNIRGRRAASRKLAFQTSREKETSQWWAAPYTPAGGLRVPACSVRVKLGDGGWNGQKTLAGRQFQQD